MSKRNWFVITSVLRLSALTGILLFVGCRKSERKDELATGTPGITATEIKIGQTMPYSGPTSSYGVVGKTEQAYFKMVNEKGGIGGRNINLISYDDGGMGPDALKEIRKLVESDGVAFIFNSLGTAPNTAFWKYLNDKKVPQLFVASGADKWADPAHYPWTMGWNLSYRVESKIYAQFLLREKPGSKACVLYQNDDFGRDYLAGLHDGFGNQYDKIVIKTASYEVTDPTVDSQVVTLQAAGCDVLVTAATPKFAAGVIRKIFDIGWKPFHVLSNVAVSVTSVLQPAGLEKSVGIITGLYLKDNSDPAYADDAGMNEYRAFMKQYLPGMDVNDISSVYGFGAAATMIKVLTQCGNDLSRENIMKQAASISGLALPVAIPGIEMNTSATNFHPFLQMQLARFNGKSFDLIGAVMGTE